MYNIEQYFLISTESTGFVLLLRNKSQSYTGIPIVFNSKKTLVFSSFNNLLLNIALIAFAWN